MRMLLLAAIIHILPVPQPDRNALPPVTEEDAKAYCEAYGGTWNLYESPTRDAAWYECDEPGDDTDLDAQCDAAMSDEDASYWGSCLCRDEGLGCPE